ncbi:MAG: GNAT family N-acetyltransferase [Psychroserpens sp.]|uniref:GNAT family N-acetyltransferase n=1 Tax=Psychroserpens sp. TaxID=2020870 RepID=UPI0030022F62
MLVVVCKWFYVYLPMEFYIETERLIMRELLPSDVDGIFELDGNTEVHKYLGNNPITTKTQAEKIIAFIREQYLERGIGRFATIEKSSGDFIGWSGFKLNTGDNETLGSKRDFYDIGYRFIPKYWGKGYATESSLAVLNYGFQKLKLDVVFGAAEVDNIASNKILQKIGLQHMEQFPYKGNMINWYKLKKEDHAKTMS